MIIIHSVEKLNGYLTEIRKEGKTVGFAPTMGALHQGHVSLITAAKKQCDIVVCSIFVNPTQFNDLSDLEKYPRTIDADCVILRSAGCDILFAPEVSEIYTARELELKQQHMEDKSWTMGKTVDFGLLDKVMEGAHRPGHFNGVAQVVSKLFRIVQPVKAFFGQKDFQQLSVIRSMVKQLDLPIEIIACPIVRETDGLAMSSRNRRLSAEERDEVKLIYQTLSIVKENYQLSTIADLKKLVEVAFKLSALIKLDYFEIVDSETLQPIAAFDTGRSAVACIAVQLQTVRLIDNVIIY